MSAPVPRTVKQLGIYQFREQIGKGAKGVVYKAINMENASVVAIKQISVQNLGDDAEKAVEMEISLLKNLKHENIVKYIDAISTETHLHIVLEYADAGCLHSTIIKSGAFPEILVAIYIKQVLTGLDYLHSQGVVHRDVKGANILTTREGIVKLADFGVATKINDGEKAHSAVGTPYWMAPEIIEMRGNVSTSCDIWSVGCTVIELITGSPPYSDLNKWSALFRIVQDNHPPLPNGISETCKDFLLKCFQKDVTKRMTAKELLSHPWIGNQNQNAYHMYTDPNNQFPPEVNNTVRLHIDQFESLPIVPKAFRESDLFKDQKRSILEDDRTRYSEEKKHSENRESKIHSVRIAESSPEAQFLRNKGHAGTQKFQERQTPGQGNIQNEHQNENSLYRLTNSFVAGRESLNRSNSNPDLQNPQYSMYMRNSPQVMDNKSNPMYFTQAENQIKQLAGRPSESVMLPDEGSFVVTNAGTRNYYDPSRSNVRGHVLAKPQQESKFVKEMSGLVLRLAKNSPHEGTTNFAQETNMDLIHARYSTNERWSTRETTDNALTRDFGQEAAAQYLYTSNQHENFENVQPPNVQETLQDLQRLEAMFHEYPTSQGYFMKNYGLTGLIDILDQTDIPDVKEEVLQVINTLTSTDHALQAEGCLFGVLPHMIKYASYEFPKTLRVHAAKFLGRLIDASDILFKMFLASGGFKALVELLDTEYEHNKNLVGFAIEKLGMIFERKILPIPHICRILVTFGISHRLMTVTVSLINDAREAEETGGTQEARDFLLQALSLIDFFAKCDDDRVKDQFGQEDNLLLLNLNLKVLQRWPQILSKCARILRHLSSEPSVLERIGSIGLLPNILRLISKEKATSSQASEESLIELLKLLFHMCQLNPSRQEEVVEHGGVEVLVEVKRDSTKAVESYIITTLCQFVETSEKTRKRLWENGGPKLLLEFMDDDSHQPKILDTIAMWFELEPENIEEVLLEFGVFNTYVQIFKSAKKLIFQQIVPIYLHLIERSEKFASKLSRTPEFLREIVERLGMEPTPQSEDKIGDSKRKPSGSRGSKTGVEFYGKVTKRTECINPSALVRKELLDILLHICNQHPNPRALMNEHNLFPIILRFLHLSQHDEMVILTEIATELLKIYSEEPTSTNRYETSIMMGNSIY